MRRTSERILTTHTGSFPHPEALTRSLTWCDHDELGDSDAEALPGQIREAVADIICVQVEAGVDIVKLGDWRSSWSF